MPGSVQNAAVSLVMPWSLCKAFSHSREILVNENSYRDGSSQRGLLVQTSRKRFSMTRLLTPALLGELRDFFVDDCNYGIEAFYFYDVHEASPKFQYDPTGESEVGRYVMRFDCPWSQTVGIARSEVPLEILELA
jgi:hypothetical protein